jgi:hypothetical protein
LGRIRNDPNGTTPTTASSNIEELFPCPTLKSFFTWCFMRPVRIIDAGRTYSGLGGAGSAGVGRNVVDPVATTSTAGNIKRRSSGGAGILADTAFSTRAVNVVGAGGTGGCNISNVRGIFGDIRCVSYDGGGIGSIDFLTTTPTPGDLEKDAALDATKVGFTFALAGTIVVVWTSWTITICPRR